MAWATASDATRHWKEAAGLDPTELAELLESAYLEVVAFAPKISDRVVTDAVTSSGSKVVTSALAGFSELDVGRTVTGTGIPVDAKVDYVNGPSSVVLSAAATASATVTATVSGVPRNFVLANVYQARDVWTAQQRGDTSSDVVGVGDFVVRARPLSAMVRQLLRPEGRGMFLVG